MDEEWEAVRSVDVFAQRTFIWTNFKKYNDLFLVIVEFLFIQPLPFCLNPITHNLE